MLHDARILHQDANPEVFVSVVSGPMIAKSSTASGCEAARLIGDAFVKQSGRPAAEAPLSDPRLAAALEEAAQAACAPRPVQRDVVHVQGGGTRTVPLDEEVPSLLALAERDFPSGKTLCVSIQGLWACTRTPFPFFDWFQNKTSMMGLVVDEDYVLTDGAADPIGYLDVS